MNCQRSFLGDMGPVVLRGADRADALALIERFHYSHSIPSGKSHVIGMAPAVVIFSIPANKNIGRFLLGDASIVWELTRLWAPDGHAPNLLTQAISAGVALFHRLEPSVAALVSYADPNVGHAGGVYRAASWLYTGQSSESRYYLSPDGHAVARRAFHSGENILDEKEIAARGYVKSKRPGKHRFARGLNNRARKLLVQRFSLATMRRTR